MNASSMSPSRRIVVAALVRNEADRYLRSALRAWSEFADSIVVLDDYSTDDTPVICKEFPKVQLYSRESSGVAWGDESPARAELWDLVVEATEEGDIIMVLDADMVPASDPREYAHIPVGFFYYTLYDLWDASRPSRMLYRDDQLWCGHKYPRLWATRRPRDDFEPLWGDRGIHCGHFPSNLAEGGASGVVYLSRDAALLHFAYAEEKDRKTKHAKYINVAHLLTVDELAHAETIVDSAPHLLPLYWTPKWVLTKECA